MISKETGVHLLRSPKTTKAATQNQHSLATLTKNNLDEISPKEKRRYNSRRMSPKLTRDPSGADTAAPEKISNRGDSKSPPKMTSPSPLQINVDSYEDLREAAEAEEV